MRPTRPGKLIMSLGWLLIGALYFLDRNHANAAFYYGYLWMAFVLLAAGYLYLAYRPLKPKEEAKRS